jgi:hypothetical protein
MDLAQGASDPGWIVLSSPLGRPLHALLLEVVVLAAFGLTIAHVVSRHRRGDRAPLFRWLAILAYGLQMEWIAFNYLHNYVHAQFTVQLYHGLLPLYVPCIYVVLHYTALDLVGRLGQGALRQALLAGFVICLLDVPFDILGVNAGWWRWTDTDPNLAHRWLGVPVTSYEWYLIFGAVLAALVHLFGPRVAARPPWVLVLAAPLLGAAVIAGGVLAFLPFHALVAVGLGPGTIVAAHLVVGGGLGLAALAAPAPAPRSPPVVAAVLLLQAWYGLALAWLWVGGELHDPGAQVACVLAAMAGAVAVAVWSPRRGASVPAAVAGAAVSAQPHERSV